MIEEILNVLRNWKIDVEKDLALGNIYLFGSATYRNGIMFNPNISDLDLIIEIPDCFNDALKRRNWILSLKQHKTNLEQKLLFLLKKSKSDKEIVSIIPITNKELQNDIHKSAAPRFFQGNDFTDVSTGKVIKGADLIRFQKIDDELFIQVLQCIQKQRNLFLKNCSTKDFQFLRIENLEDVVPKELAREAAMVYAMKEGEKHNGDRFNLSYGTDYIKGSLLKLNDTKEFDQLYAWVDNRSGGRYNTLDKNSLVAEEHLLLYELLYDLAVENLQKKNDNEINRENLLSEIRIKEEFLDFLDSSELLTKAHSKKEKILLSDIFIYPQFTKYNSTLDKDEIIGGDKLLNNFLDISKILIAGENQSGKTALCKKIFTELKARKFLPIYINDKKNYYNGKIEDKIKNAFIEQYISGIHYEDIDKNLIVPIIDDFQYARHKDKIIADLTLFDKQILIVDDIFSLNLKDESITKLYHRFKIREFSPSYRNVLIRKWITLSDNNSFSRESNDEYKQIDHATELVNTSLGKIIGSGIMPAYPFFILSVISTYETFDKPLDQEITSQGYCYQALIYLYLRKQGVKNDEIDTYINFLTELAHFFYKKKSEEISQTKFDEFIEIYRGRFNLPVEIDEILENLQKANIFSLDSCNNYTFNYTYLYYFFVGKYLADNLDLDTKDKSIQTEIRLLMSNLHKDENAYIAVFLSHHTKKAFVLDEIIINAATLFENFNPSTLSEAELSFFDSKADIIADAVLPPSYSNPEKARETTLIHQDKIEDEKINSNEKDINENSEDDPFSIEIRRSIKTVEVMGSIIKNRAGSLEKTKLESVFSEGMQVHLRVISHFVKSINDEEFEKEIVNFISDKLEAFISKQNKHPSRDKVDNLSKTIFWNLNFGVIFSILEKVIHSLGSNKLTQIIENVCDKENTPATFIIKQGILMWYNKNLQIDNIADKIDNDGFSKTAKKKMMHKIVNYCRLHSVNFKEKQKIERRFKIPTKELLTRAIEK